MNALKIMSQLKADKLAAIILIILLFNVGCMKQDQSHSEKKPDDATILAIYATNPVVALTISAGKHLRHLQQQGILPGVSSEEHGKINSLGIEVSKTPEKFPISRTF